MYSSALVQKLYKAQKAHSKAALDTLEQSLHMQSFSIVYPKVLIVAVAWETCYMKVFLADYRLSGVIWE